MNTAKAETTTMCHMMTQEADPDSYYPEIRPQACHGIVCDTSYVTFQLHMHTALQIRCCVLFRDLHFKAE